MRVSNVKSQLGRAFVLLNCLAIGFVSTGCDSDNPVDGTKDQHHADAFGLVIYSSGAEVVRLEKGVVTGEIEVGHEKETALLTVRFLSEDGQTFTPHEELKLAYKMGDDKIAKIEAHPEDGQWSFHVVGLSEGETTLVISLLHGDHADFVSKEIHIHVEEDGPGSDHGDHDDHDDHDHD